MMPSSTSFQWTQDGVIVTTDYPAYEGQEARREVRVFVNLENLVAYLSGLWGQGLTGE